MTQATLTNYPKNTDTRFEDVRNDTNDILDTSSSPSIFESFGYKFTRKLIGASDVEQNTKMFDTDKLNVMTPTQNEFSVFQPDDPYHSIVNTTDQDFIFTYGIQIRYYMVKPREEQKYLNDTYGENANREYYGAVLESNSRFAFLTEVNPIIAYGIYAPTEMNQEMTKNSIDTSREASFLFNIVYLRNLLGRDPQIGDVLLPFDLPVQIYEIMQIMPANKTLYVPRRFSVKTQLAQWSL